MANIQRVNDKCEEVKQQPLSIGQIWTPPHLDYNSTAAIAHRHSTTIAKPVLLLLTYACAKHILAIMIINEKNLTISAHCLGYWQTDWLILVNRLDNRLTCSRKKNTNNLIGVRRRKRKIHFESKAKYCFLFLLSLWLVQFDRKSFLIYYFLSSLDKKVGALVEYVWVSGDVCWLHSNSLGGKFCKAIITETIIRMMMLFYRKRWWWWFNVSK